MPSSDSRSMLGVGCRGLLRRHSGRYVAIAQVGGGAPHCVGFHALRLRRPSAGRAAGNSPLANPPRSRYKRLRMTDLLERWHTILAKVSIIGDCSESRLKRLAVLVLDLCGDTGDPEPDPRGRRNGRYSISPE